MDFNYITTVLVESVRKRCHPRFSQREVEQSLFQVASRWKYVLGYHEKRAIARNLGGSRYTTTTYALLEELFEVILKENDGR